eukprot:CAMPEP_0177395716 /NCGR_PEP_ID=MMETSP0368-20130122/56312_1 /TAXON_ID=447022 ORGANISM="Scrippsiella hangoei-like, Strain SHHI-4" /NCGR_SAMPLE_ID=MMETSP0368 /ASSEMBLY_ACC=CAM_ASM_000363 /LENGTH=41 /DNA_ID= /DNA_START= /DNA_END= /DNA_ORIENTATION=
MTAYGAQESQHAYAMVVLGEQTLAVTMVLSFKCRWRSLRPS